MERLVNGTIPSVIGVRVISFSPGADTTGKVHDVLWLGNDSCGLSMSVVECICMK